MPEQMGRRGFLKMSAAALGTVAVDAVFSPGVPAGKPEEYVIVEGHRDIWELNDRLALRDRKQTAAPMRDFVVPRMIEAGMSVCIMPACGDSVEERHGRQAILEGSLMTLDMLLTEIEKCGDKASIIKTKADIPSKPNRGKVQFFLDIEGGGSIEIEPEPDFIADRRLFKLRHFFRLGCRGLQLTHNGRNQLADGRGADKVGGKLSPFGVEVVREMNRLGMMVGVSHLSTAGVMHACEVSKHPIVSTHQNLERFVKSHPPVEITDEEAQAIAKTGGVVGIRYIEGQTSYKVLVDEIEYLAKLIGTDHIGVGWLGHDVVHPYPSTFGPSLKPRPVPTGVEAQTMRQHWEIFIAMLGERGFKEPDINKIVGANFLRIWNQILPA